MSKLGWVAFGAKVKTTESTFNQPVAGASLKKGHHANVTIEAIEPGGSPQYPAVKVVWGKDGETKQGSIFFEGKNFETQETEFSRQYLGLASALVSDVVLRQKFFGEMVPQSPSLLNNLIGMKADIKIDYKKVSGPDSKFKILNTGEAYKVVDAFDDETIPEGLDDVYETYAKAKEDCQENGLKLSYLEVLYINPVKDVSVLEEQNLRIQEIVDGANKPKVASTKKF